MPLSPRRFIPQHARNRAMERRTKKADPLYASDEWKHLRERVMHEEKRCRSCGALPAKGDQADHILPVKTHPGLAFVRSNIQRLCASCHSSKTGKRDGGFGRARNSSTQGNASLIIL